MRLRQIIMHFVMGRNANGLTEWKSEKGKTLIEFENDDKLMAK